jgi:hypothetical protein
MVQAMGSLNVQLSHRLVQRAARLAALAVVAVVVTGCGMFCCTDYMWNLWALNDSDQDVLVHTTFEIPRTVRVPGHTYVPIGGGHGAVEKGWTVELFDASCNRLQTLTLESGYDPLLYVAPNGRVEIRHGSAWTNTVASAKPAPTVSPAPSPCPGG